MNIDVVKRLLDWPFFNFDWSTSKYSWNSRNELIVLLWVSTKFDDYNDFVAWCKNEAAILPNPHLNSYITWLYPSSSGGCYAFNEGNAVKKLLFVYNCLERSLLWSNPEPTWPSELHKAIKISRRLLKESICSESNVKSLDLASSFLGDFGWGDFGWLKHYNKEYGDLICVFHEMLVLSQQFSQQENLDDITQLVIKARNALFFTVSMFWEKVDRGFYRHDYLYDQEEKRLLDNEMLWCNEIFVSGASLNWDCVTCP